MNADVRPEIGGQWWVRSRGQRPAQDYTWAPAKADSGAPPLVASDPLHINAPGSLSIFVGWLQIADVHALVLFADGLTVPDVPTDHQGRPIEIAVLGIVRHRSEASSVAAALLSVAAPPPLRGSELARCVSYAPSYPAGFSVDSKTFSSVIQSHQKMPSEAGNAHDLRWGPRSELQAAVADAFHLISSGYWPDSSALADPSIVLAASDLIDEAWCAEFSPFRAVGDLIAAPTQSEFLPRGRQRGGQGKVGSRRRAALALLLLILSLTLMIVIALGL